MCCAFFEQFPEASVAEALEQLKGKFSAQRRAHQAYYENLTATNASKKKRGMFDGSRGGSVPSDGASSCASASGAAPLAGEGAAADGGEANGIAHASPQQGVVSSSAAPAAAQGTRTCNKCHAEKPRSEFSKSQLRNSIQLGSKCVACVQGAAPLAGETLLHAGLHVERWQTLPCKGPLLHPWAQTTLAE